MKSKALITISLCSVFAMGAISLGGASVAGAATSSVTEYPEIFTEYVNDNLEDLRDFATDGKSFAFADRNCIIVVKDEERTKYDVRGASAIEYYNGSYLYKLGSNSYSLSDNEPVNYDFDSINYSRVILANGSEYKIHTDGKCYYLAENELNFAPIEDSNTCVKLKKYNNVAYAVMNKDAESGALVVKKLSGTADEDVNPSYIDFTGVEKVALGTIKNSLKTFNLKNLHFVTLDYASYYTEINIENLSGDHFDADRENTFRCGDSGALPAGEAMLALGETGNATVFTCNGKCYIALSSNLHADESANESYVEQAEFTRAYINAPDWVYTSPFLCNATKSVTLSAGDAVKVLERISDKSVGYEFYKIEFGEGEEKSTGYILSNMLLPLADDETEHPDDKNFGVIEDDHYSENDLVKIAVLLMIVVVLVLIGLSYITYVLTSGKRKARKKAEAEENKTE